MDPYERLNLYIGESNIEGMRFADGIFAKRVIPHFRLVAIYAGNLLNQASYDALFSPNNVTDEEYENIQKNLISLNDDITIDIPPRYSNILDYRSSLGHKVNHNFDENKINAEF